MKSALIWMKHNPIAVVAAILCVCSLLGLLVVRFQASSFMKEMEDRNSVVQKVKTLKSTRVKIPSPDLDNPVEERDITINEPAIEALKEVYRAMGIEYKNIFALAVDQNRKGHDPLLDGLFPDPGTHKDKLYDSRVQYLNAFESMLLYYSPTDIYPRLNAGGPVDMVQLSSEVELEQKNFLMRLGLENAKPDQLTPEQQRNLADVRRGAAYRVMKQHAAKYHIYVDNLEDRAAIFMIGAWSQPAHYPTLSEIWQGQMELWVQQDIVEAIGTANNIWDASFNVTRNPVKKLLKITVIPGYVGINTQGALTNKGGKLTPGAPPSGETRLPNGFMMTPTGRRSNTIYDVVHAQVSLIVDYQQIPKLFEAFGKTNFMTVLNANITDVDEYEALKNGFFYGTGDCVQLDMVVETLWLREWTTRLMPQRIKKLLSIEEPEAK
jgi:hypothetical protein